MMVFWICLSSMKYSEFNDIIEVTLEFEQGYVNNPRDPGGETNFGISKRAYPDLDIRGLTKDQAISIYKKDYWTKYKIDQYPTNLRLIMFDMTIHHGSRNAVKILQRAINNKALSHGNTWDKLKVDGTLGPATRAGIDKWKPEATRVLALRAKFVTAICRVNPDLDTMFYGLMKRNFELFQYIQNEG